MALGTALTDAWTAIRENPIILVATFVFVLLVELFLLVGIFKPSLLLVGYLAYIVAIPGVYAGFIGMAYEAVETGSTSRRAFPRYARRYYVSMLVATLAAGLILAIIYRFVLVGLGSVLAGTITTHLITSVGILGLLLLLIVFSIIVIMGIKFYAASVVVDDLQGGFAGLSSFVLSAVAVRNNVRSVIGYGLLVSTLSVLIVTPGLLLYAFSIEFAPDGTATVVSPVLMILSFVVSLTVETVGLGFLYTLYVAYYVRLVRGSGGTPAEVITAEPLGRETEA